MCARFTSARGAPGGDIWEVLGHYMYALELDGRGWRVSAMILEKQHELGNRSRLRPR
jgi:hypothetical protein